MRRATAWWAMIVLLAAGCAAKQVQSDPGADAKLDDLARTHERLALRMDELARTVLDLQDRLERIERGLAATPPAEAKPAVTVVEEIAPHDAPTPTPVPVEEGALPEPEPEPGLEVVKLAPPAPAYEEAGQAVAAAPAVKAGQPPASEPRPYGPATEAYGRAYIAYREGRYARAILDFEEFLLRYPDHEHADKAQYWIGESFYSQGEYEQAVVEFNRVVERYPDKPRAPDAYLMIAGCYEKLGDAERARGFYNRLVEQYPQSEAARRAAEKLNAPE